MNLRGVILPPAVRGSLWLSSMPGRFEPWRDFLAEATHRHLALVTCLTPLDELAELSPDYAEAVRLNRLPFEWLHLPMRNFGLPEDPGGFRHGIARLAERVQAGDAVLLHCAAGMGRTGSAAACVLKQLGLPTQEAPQRVRDAGSNPQNAAQSGFVDWF